MQVTFKHIHDYLQVITGAKLVQRYLSDGHHKENRDTSRKGVVYGVNPGYDPNVTTEHYLVWGDENHIRIYGEHCGYQADQEQPALHPEAPEG